MFSVAANASIIYCGTGPSETETNEEFINQLRVQLTKKQLFVHPWPKLIGLYLMPSSVYSFLSSKYDRWNKWNIRIQNVWKIHTKHKFTLNTNQTLGLLARYRFGNRNFSLIEWLAIFVLIVWSKFQGIVLNATVYRLSYLFANWIAIACSHTIHTKP